MTMVAAIVIGRNEGERLVACLASLGDAARLIYVDSGSTDDSIVNARAAGADVVMLDMARPFTAARGRNAGLEHLAQTGFAGDYVQMVDGDCTLAPGWLAAGRTALDADPALAGVFGRLRERHPDASLYNWLCDVEWQVPPGPARAFSGNVMLRRQAAAAAGNYPTALAAGEEPDLSIRLRAAGWHILCLDADMGWHDAAMTRFGQWWRRAVRAGSAYAALASRHRDRTLSDYGRRLKGVAFWAVLVPLIILLLLPVAPLAALAVALLIPTQILRSAFRLRRPWREAVTIASFHMLAKPAQAIGALRWLLTGRDIAYDKG